RSAARPPRRRSQPTPGRDAGARTARNRRVWRRRAPEPGCRTRRTSDVPELHGVVPFEWARVCEGDEYTRPLGAFEAGVDAAPGGRLVNRAVVREREPLRVPPDEAHELCALAAKEDRPVAAVPPGGDAGDVGDEADAADDGSGRDRSPTRLVVERNVSGHDRD